MLNSEVLVLNSGFIPIRLANVREAITLLVTDKAYSVVEKKDVVKSPSLIVKIPSVISLIGYAGFPKKKVAFSKLNVIYRDDLQCQYCGERHPVEELTVDHVIPRSKWTKSVTPTNWENLVACCKRCNYAKGGKTLRDLGWRLLNKPVEPKYMPHLVIKYKKAERNGWLPYCRVNVRLLMI